MASHRPFEVLVVGCGHIAGGFDMARAPGLPPLSHAGAFTQHGGFRIKACVDSNENQRKEFARHWGVISCAADLDTLDICSGAFDVISICTPTTFHHQHIAQALALQPRVIFCEKPLTSDEGLSAELIQACRMQNVALVVNYSRRWDPTVAEFVSQIHDGRWGLVRSVVGHYNKGIFNNGSHMVDLLLRLLGPLQMVATTHTEFDFWQDDPTVAVLLTAANGSIPVYLNPAHARDFSHFELEIVCELGVIRMLSGGMAWQFRNVVSSPHFSGYMTLDSFSHVDGRYMETMARAIEDIYLHLQSGTPVGSTGESALQVQKLCSQIYRDAMTKSMPECLIKG